MQLLLFRVACMSEFFIARNSHVPDFIFSSTMRSSFVLVIALP